MNDEELLETANVRPPIGEGQRISLKTRADVVSNITHTVPESGEKAASATSPDIP